MGRTVKTVSKEQWEEAERKAKLADKILHSKEFADIPAYLKVAEEQAKEMILTNRIKEVREEVTIAETLKKVFITPKKVQEDEIIGTIKFIRQFVTELQSWIEQKNELLNAEDKGRIQIERSKEG